MSFFYSIEILSLASEWHEKTTNYINFSGEHVLFDRKLEFTDGFGRLRRLKCRKIINGLGHSFCFEDERIKVQSAQEHNFMERDRFFRGCGFRVR